MPTIIVQGIPFNKSNKHHSLHYPRADCKYNACINEEKVVLEKLFSNYCEKGPPKCLYLWSLRTECDFHDERYEPDNFAHMKIGSASDVSRICDAARNKEIRINHGERDFVLTVTSTSTSSEIEKLDDDCLNHIFSMLKTSTHLKIADVCTRWEKLAVLHMRKFNVSGYLQKNYEKPLAKYGLHIKDIKCSMWSSYFCTLIATHCENVESVDIYLDQKDPKLVTSGKHHISAMLAALRKLKSIRLRCELTLSDFAVIFKYYAWGTLEKIDLSFCRDPHVDFGETTEDVVPFDLSKFRKLKTLYMFGDKIGDGGIIGWEALENLTELELFVTHLHPRLAVKMESLSKLRILNLPCVRIKDHFLIRILKNNPNIEEILMCTTLNLTEKSMQYVWRLPKLKQLNMASMRNVTFESFRKMPTLERLHCNGVQVITDEILERIIPLMPNITWFTVSLSPVTSGFLRVANELVKNRESGAKLRIETRMPTDGIDIEDLSPLLEIHVC